MSGTSFKLRTTDIELSGSDLQWYCHGLAVACGWWTDMKTGDDMRGRQPDGTPKRNVGELIALCHSELSEALEGERKGKMDEHLPDRLSLEVELADTIIRCFDLAGGLGLDLGAAIAAKLKYNQERADHQLANRAAEGGKRF